MSLMTFHRAKCVPGTRVKGLSRTSLRRVRMLRNSAACMTPCVLPEMIGVTAANAYDCPDLSGIAGHLHGFVHPHRTDRNRRLHSAGAKLLRLDRTREEELLP